MIGVCKDHFVVIYSYATASNNNLMHDIYTTWAECPACGKKSEPVSNWGNEVSDENLKKVHDLSDALLKTP
jgi:hypothetical protein